MNENLNLVEILKDCPKGERFWSPLFGEVEFDYISKVYNEIYVKVNNDDRWLFNPDGTIKIGNIPSQTIMLYPSKHQRDWSKFTAPWLKKERFDPKILKPFDKVLARDVDTARWRCGLFSHIINENIPPTYQCICEWYRFCIPYNDDTKHLVGTNEEAPEYYKYWED